MKKSRIHRTKTVVMTAALGLLLIAGAAHAEPTWMGVFGPYERHGGGNPGTYTISMNDDYFGLHAEVGIQVDGGEWNDHDMIYDGIVGDNSMWVFTPETPYPQGATLACYFHGYDDWDFHIWDSNNGANYVFTLPAGSTTIEWAAPRALPTERANAMEVEITAHDGLLYAVWTEGDSPTSIMFSKKAPGEDWEPKSEIVSHENYPSIAVSESGIHVLYGYYLNAYYIRSTDGGTTWSTPIAFGGVNYPARYAALRAIGDYLYVVYNDYIPPEVSRLFLRRIHVEGSSWEDPVSIFEYTSYKTTVHVKDFEVRGTNMYLSSYGQSWYGGFTSYFFHESTDTGASWREDNHQGRPAHLAADGTMNAYVAALDTGPGGDGIHLQKRVAGGGWTDAVNVWPGSGSVDALKRIDSGLVVISHRDEIRYYRVSQDEGATWTDPVQIEGEDSWCVQDVQDGNAIHLLVSDQTWPATYYTISGEPPQPDPQCFVGALVSY